MAGATETFEDLVRAERDALVRTARAILADPGEAEDCAQEALVAAWTHRDDLRDPGRVRPWLMTILLRIARRRRRHPLLRLFRPAADLDWVPARDGAPDPRLAALAREVRRLPEKQRLPLTLHYLAGLSYREVAGTLGIPEGLVKSRLFEAREKLRRRMKEE